jgi:hypothetical protein
MSGEMRLTKGAVLWTAVAAVPASIVAGLVDGRRGVLSISIAIAIVLANALATAGISVLAGRFSPTGAAMIALPSFALRMSMVVALLELVKVTDLVIPPIFAATFAGGVALVLFIEARTYRRTPWLALTFAPKEEA